MIWLIIVPCVIVFLLVFGKDIWHGATVKLTSITYDEKAEIMTFNYEDKTTIQYKGSCTVWHRLPSFRRCDTLTEMRLSEYWEMCRHYGGNVDLSVLKKKS